MAKEVKFKQSRPKPSMKIVVPKCGGKMRGIDKPSPRKVKHV